jgi:hypothetical protein
VIQVMTRRLELVLLGALLVVGPMLGRAAAGIVVLEDGRTIVGKFAAKDVTADRVTVRSPWGQTGEIAVERHRVRWFDASADEPTDAYFDRFYDAPLEPRWDARRRAYDEAHRATVDPSLPPIGGEELLRAPALETVVAPHLRLLAPRGWFMTAAQGITMIVAPKVGQGGHAPRLHVFSVEAPSASPAEQLAWAQTEGGYTTEGASRLRPVPGGFDQDLETVTRRGDRVVRALRRISFRARRTYFFVAYADDPDFDDRRPLFEACRGGFTPEE